MYEALWLPKRWYLRPSIQRVRNLDVRTDFVKKLEQFQTKCLKTLLGCPSSSSPAIVRLFSGVEPLSSRFDLLKLRYFWKISHGDEYNVAFKVYNLRRKKFYGIKYGFVHEVLNLCCKYDVIDFWHGKVRGGINPKNYIRKKILNYNLKLDLKVGRSKSCEFSKVYLKNVFMYQDDFHMVKPFKIFNFFTSVKARSLIIKVLLYPCVFLVNCEVCGNSFYDIFDHYINTCRYLANQRQHLRRMLNFYNFPKIFLLKREKFFATCLEKKTWMKCLTDFLEDVCP